MPMSENEIRAAIQAILDHPDHHGPLYGSGKQPTLIGPGKSALEAISERAERAIAEAGDMTGERNVAAG